MELISIDLSDSIEWDLESHNRKMKEIFDSFSKNIEFIRNNLADHKPNPSIWDDIS